MDSEEGIKIYNITEEIKQYQKKIAKLKQENKQLKEKVNKFNIDKIINEIKSLKGSCKVLGEKDNNQRKELQRLNNKIENLKQENKQLKANWNKLKNIAKSQSDFKQKLGNDRVYFEIDELLEKMQELEKSNSNE